MVDVTHLSSLIGHFRAYLVKLGEMVAAETSADDENLASAARIFHKKALLCNYKFFSNILNLLSIRLTYA